MEEAVKEEPKSASQTKEWFVRHSHHISALAFVCGFMLDLAAFPDVDSLAAHIAIASYLVCVFAGILFVQMDEEHRLYWGTSWRFAPLFPPAVQFVFGGLFSAVFVLYFRAASVWGSWPFLVVVAVLLVMNEVLRSRYARLDLQMSALFLVIILYAALYLPYLVKDMSAAVFLLAGGIAVLVISCYAALLASLASVTTQRSSLRLFLSLLAIYVAVNALYFTNTIPPIPLALRDAVIAHSVARDSSGDYRVAFEPLTWKESIGLPAVFHLGSNDEAYFYASVYAPVDLSAPIVHVWQYHDPRQGAWVTKSRIPFRINGGRAGGYRGYSVKGALEEGEWRVIVETERGQWLGVKRFDIVSSNLAVALDYKLF
jgi:hypothetical protein